MITGQDYTLQPQGKSCTEQNLLVDLRWMQGPEAGSSEIGAQNPPTGMSPRMIVPLGESQLGQTLLVSLGCSGFPA